MEGGANSGGNTGTASIELLLFLAALIANIRAVVGIAVFFFLHRQWSITVFAADVAFRLRFSLLPCLFIIRTNVCADKKITCFME